MEPRSDFCLRGGVRASVEPEQERERNQNRDAHSGVGIPAKRMGPGLGVPSEPAVAASSWLTTG